LGRPGQRVGQGGDGGTLGHEDKVLDDVDGERFAVADPRLITTLLDPQHHPAADLIRLYHERWEIETAYLELKSSSLGDSVLRARTPAGVDQEVHALLVTGDLAIYRSTTRRNFLRHRR
jgi:hypothetical protein